MGRMSETREPTRATGALLAALVFLVALNLRPAIAAVGPVLARIGADLNWGESVQGILSAMPLWAFAAVSPLVRLVTARIGADRTILIALLTLAAGDLARSFGGPAGVWLGTLAVGSGIAIGNVLVPVIAKRDYPHHIPIATGVYSACITTGSAIAGLTCSHLADILGGWRPALAVWAIPALIVAVLWIPRLRTPAPSDAATTDGGPDHTRRTDARTTRTPLRRRPMTWYVTLYMGLQSAAFYTMSNWLPSFVTAGGHTAAQAGVHLFVFQSIGILSGLLIPALMHVHGSQTTAALVSSTPMVVALLGWMLAPRLSLLWSIIGGMGQGASLVAALTMITLRARTPEETVALSGFAQSVGYLLASIGPLAFGALAELTGTWTAPLTMSLALAIAQCAVSPLAGRERENPANGTTATTGRDD